jgi:hypothetical protein
MPVEFLNVLIFAIPQSITKRTPEIVTEVSAILVERTILV